ncbi:protein ACCELERATED CELL DEATH 6-like [Chenopodium quinoa]|uniref:protein ACCELERATED CELL DEATH 6-like n=1 Tax=Chenopodium quinoa TaxID=63459 RepID=UPI000B785F4B|nr:protein ACCELERATED CELL DEATH 6-like [Chenopodium quinoa]
MDKLMNEDLYKTAVEGSTEKFEKAMAEAHTEIDVESGQIKLDEEYFCRQTPGGNNIVHIALRHGSANADQFVKIAVEHFTSLSMRPDNNGDTPLHLAVKCKDSKSGELLVNASKGFLGELDERRKAFYVAPWAVKNNKGNFPIHEALQTNNLNDAFTLLKCDDEAASRVNDLGETPLHSFAKNGFSITVEKADEFVKRLRDTSSQAAYIRDDEGLTPLMCAARSGCFSVLRAILEQHPQSAYLLDSSGKTFLHLLRFTGEDADRKMLFDIPEADAQRLVQDYDGNTPLHHAIQTENTAATISLAKRCLETKLTELELANKRGQTIRDLLALHDVPNEIVKQIRYKMPEAVYLAKRSYGICKTDTKESANALSVVAALLATITFAAAFQVPGGFNGDDGSPILLEKTAFIIFVTSNSGAMCCSMLCLFLLLWVMVIGNIHDSLGILDIAIHLLRASFYLTLLTFTMGVFVVTAEKSLWLALLVCGLCFITFLLTWKQSISLVANNGGGFATAINKFKKFTVEPIQEQFNKFKKFIVEPIQEQFNKLRGRCYRNHDSVEEQRN